MRRVVLLAILVSPSRHNGGRIDDGSKTLRLVGSRSGEDPSRGKYLAAERSDAWLGMWLREARLPHQGGTELAYA